MAETIELNEDMTSDDIRAYADSVAKEVAEERQGERKSDAEIVARNSAPTKTPAAEKPSGGDPAETESQGEQSAEAASQSEESGDEAASPEWLTDDVKAEAAAYGIDESEMSDFASREEFDRAMRLFDKTALEAGRKAMEEGEGGKARNEKGQFVKKEDAEPDEPEQATQKDGRYQVALSKDLYDDEIIDEFTRMRDHYESRLEALESHFAEAQAKAEEQQIDSAIDRLNMPKLFGTSGKETADELKNRQDVFAQAKVLQAGYSSFGRNVDIATLVSRAAPMVFASEFDKHKLKQQTQKISKQSQLRQGGSPTKPQPPSDDPREEFARLYDELGRA